MNRTETDEELKNKAIAWAVALPIIFAGALMGAGAYSVFIGGAAAVLVVVQRQKKIEIKEVEK